jgi:thiamine-monophosphate kinase
MTVPGAPASGEDALIARYFRPLATDPGALGLNDDAAVLKAGDDIVVTTDALVEGVHFFSNDPADTIAQKALRVNLSDLAAKGADPAGFVLSLALRKVDERWLSDFARGLGADALASNCPLLGGDTVSTPGPLMISITAFGRIVQGQMVHRNGAKPGDRVVVTGTIGDAALGLDILKRGRVATVLAGDAASRDMLVGRYRLPRPRSALAPAIRRYANAAMDVSDGLAGDLTKLCSASGVSAVIDLKSVPLSPAASKALAAGAVSIGEIISGGDDYEVLCTVSQDAFEDFVRMVEAAGIVISPIGTIIAGESVPKWLDVNGQELPLARTSYSHF